MAAPVANAYEATLPGGSASCTYTPSSGATTASVTNTSCYRVKAQIRWIRPDGSTMTAESSWLHPVATITASTTMVTRRAGRAQININGNPSPTDFVAF
ncbi:hypothetical protein [Cellulomonas sp. URHB0016]